MLFDKNKEMNLEENFDDIDIELEDAEIDNSGETEFGAMESAEADDIEIDDDELEENVMFDDAYEIYESVCGDEKDECEIDCQKSYEDMKKDAFAFGATNDQIDGVIDQELGADAPDTVPDNVNILGANTDDFDYDEDGSGEMDLDEDIDIVIDDEDIFDSDDK